MENIKLLAGDFKNSQELGKDYLLELDVDRLLAPFYEAISKTPKKPRYGGWESREISGHSLGHWLSASAQMYIATDNQQIKERLDYVVSELAYLQSLDDKAYVSGFSRDCFDQVFTGEFEVDNFSLANWWVPWYSVDKIFAGLIDVYLYTSNKQSLDVVTKLADWAKKGTNNLTDKQFQKMLICEHGSMSENMAKLYQITKNQEYLDLAIRFCHEKILRPLIAGENKLQGKHANTQIPKVIGAAKIYEINDNQNFKDAALFFWEEVIKHHSYVIGGNSISEHFAAPKAEKLDVTTTETCNTYNMLKLTEHLYSWSHDVKYMDYYERALYNHILASQDPDSGMATYFVSTEPGHFKVYSSPEDSFWCCTGTGMENPARHLRQIYYQDQEDLFINLFISSQIELSKKGIKICQKTDFPETEETKLVFEEAVGEILKINIRVPNWIAGELTAIVNGKKEYKRSENGYLTIKKSWEKGDTIEITLPMDLQLYTAMDDSNKVAIMYGPIVLAGALGRDDFPETDIVSNHVVYNSHPKIEVPILLTDKKDLSEWIKPVDNLPLTFVTAKIGQPGDKKVKLIPFYKLHHQRYTIYWNKMTAAEYESWHKDKKEYRDKLKESTIDMVKPNQQQSEIEHNLKKKNSNSDYLNLAGRGWRDCRDDGFFSYQMTVDFDKEMYLLVTYWGSDNDIAYSGKFYERDFEILIDNVKVAGQSLTGGRPGELFNVSYPIPKNLIGGKETVEVKFSSDKDKIAGGVYGVRIISELKK